MRTAALLVLLALLAGCVASPPEAVRLTVLADRELADLQPLLDDLRRETGVELAMEYADDPDAELAAGRYRHDLAWPVTDRYLHLREKADGRGNPLPTSTTVMSSPLVLGVRPAAAARLGATPSWADIADRAAAGELRFGMTDPAGSGSGLAALVGVATAAAGTGGALTSEQVSCVALGGFLTGQVLRPRTSGELLAQFTARQDEVDAVIEHESTLLALNASGKLRAPLEIVYPRDGMMLSRFPLILLDPARRDGYQRATTWLQGERAQRWIMDHTSRRAADPALERPQRLRAPIGNALYFPDRQEVLDALLAAYRRLTSGGTHQVVFVLDYSASMAGPRVQRLRAAFAALSGTGTGGFARFHLGETITVLRFAGTVLQQQEVTITDQSDVDSLAPVVAAAADGRGTAIWSALDQAYRSVRGDAVVVLMTDGENNAGISAAEFLGAGKRAVPTYAVALGEADPAELDGVARSTGGRVVEATEASLEAAVREIRGCR
ncbi:substrate-binding domain-containing protein [Actinokineospora cianjurensis]|uniref:Ca-activated chloride channel family protein n=1 Tax=Actinokineospora cianjurensis TaxID=585224 RepID=A0A421AZW8_9PSEU|nr:substrate-binding domain-containing protein [Actinokineospora cianjurensis]RLK55321.1 Ca-activated chloride channel family protein [Actinokineospora cianjurensis]